MAALTALSFNARIVIKDINPYVTVSAARARGLRPGWKKPLPVRVRINGKPEAPWRINLMPMGNGAFYLYLHASVRKASHTGVGDKVTVEIAFDEGYRSGPTQALPKWFQKPLNADRKARRAFEALTPSGKKEIVRQLARLKTPEAKARNLARALHVLAGNPGR
ncbi:MAG: YdeI/OmpD-associated family protein, partial [Fibrobacteria bacterium]